MFDKFRMRRFCKLPMLVTDRSKLPCILLSCKSSISKLRRLPRIVGSPVWPLTQLIIFLLKIRTLNAVRFEMLEPISASLLELMSRKCRFGKDTRFSILEISLFWRFRYLTFSSPSSKGICLSALESSCIFSEFCSLSLGRLYMMRILGIYGNSTYRENVSASMLWSLPCFRR